MIDLHPAADELIRLLGAIPDDRLGDPTPCDEMTVADLIGHLDQVSRDFAALARDTEPTGEPIDVSPGAGWSAAVARRVGSLADAWDDPGVWSEQRDPELDLPKRTWGRIALTELVVHGWDLARAVGIPYALPESTLRPTLEHVRAFVPDAPVPQLWGTPGGLPDDAPLFDHVVVATGRSADWLPPA